MLSCCVFRYVCFFKQKTAYEVRISDWSSDVCSSDLLGETAEGVCAQIREAAPLLAKRSVNEAREALQTLLPRGAARNALDSALWSLEARLSQRPVWQLAGLGPPRPLATASTISLADPAVMERSERVWLGTCGSVSVSFGGLRIIKIKKIHLSI